MAIVKISGLRCGPGTSVDLLINDVYRGTLQIPCGASDADLITILKNTTLVNPAVDTIYYNSTCINLCSPYYSHTACVNNTCQTVPGEGVNECVPGTPCNSSSGSSSTLLLIGAAVAAGIAWYFSQQKKKKDNPEE